jgi:hypothetical protein
MYPVEQPAIGFSTHRFAFPLNPAAISFSFHSRPDKAGKNRL